MGQALPKPGLRPFLPDDVPMLAAIFVASIEELTGDDYSERQQQAWMEAAESEEFGKRLAVDLTLIAERTAARARKDFKESDRIRDELAAMGVAIKDSRDGTTWEVAR